MLIVSGVAASVHLQRQYDQVVSHTLYCTGDMVLAVRMRMEFTSTVKNYCG